MRVGAADPPARHDAAPDLPALLPAPQGRGRALPARAARAPRAAAHVPGKSDAGVDIVHVRKLGIVEVDRDDGGPVRQHARPVGGAVRLAVRRRVAVVAVRKDADGSAFCRVANTANTVARGDGSRL